MLMSLVGKLKTSGTRPWVGYLTLSPSLSLIISKLLSVLSPSKLLATLMTTWLGGTPLMVVLPLNLLMALRNLLFGLLLFLTPTGNGFSVPLAPPPKIQHFLWLCFHNRISAKASLVARYIGTDSCCSLCNHPAEDTVHILRDCVVAMEIWSSLDPHLPPTFFSQPLMSWNIGLSTSVAVELWALRNGLLLAHNRGINKLQVEVDAQDVISLITSQYNDLHPYSAIIHDCRLLLRMDWKVTLTHTYREANQCANKMAKKGHLMAAPFTILDFPSSDYCNIIYDDARGVIWLTVESEVFVVAEDSSRLDTHSIKSSFANRNGNGAGRGRVDHVPSPTLTLKLSGGSGVDLARNNGERRREKVRNQGRSGVDLARESDKPQRETARLLGPRARFEASKLKVVLMGEGMNGYSGITPRTYILSHCNLAANLTLTISNVINLDQLKGWYSKDDVVAEWKDVNGDMCLHVHCYVSGPNPLLDLAAEFRYHIFCKELPLVLTAALHGDSVLFRERPELLDALVWAYFHSSSKKYNRMECWGPLKDAAEAKLNTSLHRHSI
ncbi:hypothetical protein L1049_018171 [Liquidambar formosana]|uniref:Uncharacterized protein n=1 Tax=Liquidambar formosana TaxID=63359 RepID=A0AAP0NHC3_LIQFO